MFSLANVENVVNPPQIPTVRNRRISSDTIEFFLQEHKPLGKRIFSIFSGIY